MNPCPKKTAISKLNKKDNNINNSNLRKEYPETEQEDRLSNLPDNILVTILNLLPISSAAAISALNHRYRHLWTHITHLSIIFPQKPIFDNFNYFVTTVDHIISQLQSSKLHTFHLHIPDKLCLFLANATEVFTGFLYPWIHHICGRNPEVINVNFERFWPVKTRFFQIPICVFETQSLVELKFMGNIEFKYNHNLLPFINLPNLKKLHITLNDFDRPLMGTLFKTCPLLEDLYMYVDLAEGNHFIDISAPNLKCLSIQITNRVSDYCTFVIDAPKLERCHLYDKLALYEFVQNPSDLQEVIISIEELCFCDEDDNDYCSAILRIIQGIVSVRSLILAESGVNLLDCLNKLVDGNSLPIFHNLVHLSFLCNYDLYQLPVCFLGNLQRLEIQNMGANSDYDDGIVRIELLKHILNNAPVLEQLHLYVYDHDSVRDVVNEDKARTEYNFCKKLFMLSKLSLSCQIEFSGLTINASSNDFRNGVLDYQIVG